MTPTGSAAAADALDRKPMFRWVTVLMKDAYPSLATEDVPQVAALLRAVADDGEPGWDEDGNVIGASIPTWGRALALADTILGDTDD